MKKTDLIKFLDEKKIKYTVCAEGKVTVADSLDLSSVTSIPEGFNPTVGGSLYLSLFKGKKPLCKKIPEGFRASLSIKLEARFNAHGFTITDGILARIVYSRGNLKKVIIAGQNKASWLASSDDGNTHAHGKTAADAAAELVFKLSDKSDLSDLRGMPIDTEKTTHEWGLIYRRATGACKMGVENFKSTRATKEKYTLAEILEVTKGAFGHDAFVKAVS